MANRPPPSWLAWLRLVTPVVCGFTLYVVGQINAKIDAIDTRFHTHEVDRAIHVSEDRLEDLRQSVEALRGELVSALREEHLLRNRSAGGG